VKGNQNKIRAPQNLATGEHQQRARSSLLPGDLEAVDRLAHPTGSAYSCYCGIRDPKGRPAEVTEKLYRIPDGELFPHAGDRRVKGQAQDAHDQLRAKVLGEFFPCLGARAAFHHGTYRFGFYKELGHDGSVLALGYDLRRFANEYRQLGAYTTFIACFGRPQVMSESKFEQLLWKHLQKLHEHDDTPWDCHYDSDPESAHFAFSFAGEAFFVVGMHPGASRFSRRVAYPMLIFNAESQILRLQAEGQLDHFAERIRERDILFQGTINPSLPESAATTGGESRVYAGVAHPAGTPWKCPFHARVKQAEHAGRTIEEPSKRDTESDAALVDDGVRSCPYGQINCETTRGGVCDCGLPKG
jgi:FPC/CPF motif-containing protein YcgG